MKRIIVGILVLMIATMSAAAWAAKDAGPEGAPGPGGPEKGFVRTLEELNLTPDQKKQVAGILKENREQTQALRQSMKQAHEAMRQVMDTTPGDEAAVRKAAQAMGKAGEDLAVRMGGEEFGLFAYGDDAASLGERLQQLLDGLRALAIQHAPSPTAPWLTVSVGIAQADGDDTIDTLYQRADTLLYRAKGAGRNRIEVQQSLGRKSD